MQLFALIPVAAAFFASANAALVGSAGPAKCASETVAHEGFIGKDNNVKFVASRCNDAPHVSADGVISKRQSTNSTAVNVCGAQCKSYSAPFRLTRTRG